MDIVERLKQQHEEIRSYLDRIIAPGGADDARDALSQMAWAMRLHMQIEEKLVYPAAERAFSGDDDEEDVLEAYEEHAVARHSLEALEATAPNDKRFVVRAKVLRELFERHVEEEETELLPELESRVGEDGMQKLGAQVERKQAALEAELRKTAGDRGPSSTRARGARARRTAGGSSGAESARGRGAARTGGKRAPASRAAGRKSGRSGRGGTSTESASSGGGGLKPRRGESSR